MYHVSSYAYIVEALMGNGEPFLEAVASAMIEIKIEASAVVFQQQQKERTTIWELGKAKNCLTPCPSRVFI